MVQNEERKGFGSKYIGPFKIKEIIDQWTYILHSDLLERTIQRNYNQIKKIKKDNDSYKTLNCDTTIKTRLVENRDERSRMTNEVVDERSRMTYEERRYPIRTTRNPQPVYR